MTFHLRRPPRARRPHRFRRTVERRVPHGACSPEDAALYHCGCGTGFVAAVTSNVTCPACGQEQAW
jgi:hypothetical protein